MSITDLHLAYLVGQHPAINHAFLSREIQALQREGIVVSVASILPPDRPAEQLTAEERAALQTTFYVKNQPLRAIVRSHWTALTRRPMHYGRALLSALSLGLQRPSKIFRMLLYFGEAVVVGEWMLASNLRHIHTHYASTVALISATAYEYTMSATFHGPDEFTDPAGFHLARKVNASTFVCAISDFGRAQIMREVKHNQWNRLHVVRLGVDTSQIVPRAPRAKADVFEIVCPARLAAVKGQHVLVEATKLTLDAGVKVRVHFAGGGPERTELEAHVAALGLENEVLFEGFLNQNALRELYSNCDALVLPSFAEGLPVVLMEAMAMGIPCISTWVNGIPELIRNGIDGLTVAPGDPSPLAAAIQLLASNAELRRTFSVNGRNRAVEMVDVSKNVSQLAALYRHFLSVAPVQSVAGHTYNSAAKALSLSAKKMPRWKSLASPRRW